jgi:hypothetical protein
MADVTVELILQRAERFKPDRKIGTFLVNAAKLTSDGQEGVCSMYLLSWLSSAS